SSSVSTTSEREGEDYTELLAGANLRTLESPQRFVISSDSSDHSGVNIAEAEVDYVVRTFVPIMTSATTATPTDDPAAIAKERLFGSSVFHGDSSSVGRSRPISGVFSDRTGSDFLVGDEFAPYKCFASIHGMEHDQLFSEFNVGVARQISLSAKVRMRPEYNIKDKRRLKSVVEEKDSLLKSRCDEIESLKAQLLIKEAKSTKDVRLHDEAQALKEHNTNLEKAKSELEVKVTDLAASVKVREQEVADLDVVVTYVKLQNDSRADQDEKMKEVNKKFDKPCVDFVDMALHLEEKFYPHLLTTIFGRRWLLTYDMELAIAKCLNSTKYLSALEAVIGKAIEKGMQEGLSAELKANKEASVEPHVDQLMVPIYHSPDQRVVGASALSLSLDVSSSQVRRIKENIANHVSALRGVFVPLSEPLSAMALEGMEGTSSAAPDTTTALSVTSISASTILPISTDDYEIAHTKGGEGAGADVKAVADEGADPFLDVSGTELDVPE
nr:hypothetical protein [Tanacetum cinerariifolium]